MHPEMKTTLEKDGDEAKRESSAPIGKILFDEREIYLTGAIEPKRTEPVLMQLSAMNAVDREKPIKLFIDSPGGHADDGFAIFDRIRFISAPVYTIVNGLAASAATIVMVASPKERRLIMPSSRVMLHQPSVGVQGTASDIAISAREIIRLRKKANELFHKETGQPLEKLEEDMHRDFWMSPEEAVEYGLCGAVVTSESEIK